VICGNTTADETLGRACHEIVTGLDGMTGRRPAIVANGDRLTDDDDGACLVLTSQRPGEALAWPPDPTRDSFRITTSHDSSNRDDRSSATPCTTIITGASDVAVLYGVFRYLNLVRRGRLTSDVKDAPVTPLRVWNLWDNVSGSVERGYSGKSVFLWKDLPKMHPRYVDYARLLSSVGVNAIVWNNVNACEHENQHILEKEYLLKLAPLAKLFSQYGLRTFLCPCFNSPVIVGKLDTADPLDSDVVAWWRKKVEGIVRHVPSFRGFLVKADSEGEEGPMAYNRTEVDGANLFASVLDSLPGVLPPDDDMGGNGGSGVPGVVFWRSFSHPDKDPTMPGGKADQALAQVTRFAASDGSFLPNVVLQNKNGPFDFQVREPVHALFGTMPRTTQMVELQVTQEYLGQGKHVCHLPSQWKSYLDFDVTGGDHVTMADIVTQGRGGASSGGNGFFGGVAGVSNIGDDPNWTGHEFAAANTYGFGRLAWNPTLSAERVTREWVEATWAGADPHALKPLTALLLQSWEAFENYTAPLGVGFISGKDHYTPEPEHRFQYTNATKTRLGYDRGVEGGYGGTYNPAVAKIWESVETTPEELLLCFHNVPYSFELSPERGGMSVLEYIYASHRAGAVTAKGFVETWEGLKDVIDERAYGEGTYEVVTERLLFGAKEAERFADIVIDYFSQLTGVPPPASFGKSDVLLRMSR